MATNGRCRAWSVWQRAHGLAGKALFHRPAELIRIQREAREAGHNIVGFYHSHPDWPARWSSTDLDEAHWTGCSYVITSIEKGKAAGTSSFLLRGGDEAKHFEEEAIEVI